MQYLFDGSYTGFLTCLFEVFERRDFQAVPRVAEEFNLDFQMDCREVTTDPEKAARVVRGLTERAGKSRAEDTYRVFLSENSVARIAAFRALIDLFKGNTAVFDNYANPDVLLFSQTLKKVNRERHRMTAFVRFSKADDQTYFALIEPDFNVLPLITEFFRKRFADQVWWIYDLRRDYGVLYNLQSLVEIRLSKVNPSEKLPAGSVSFDEREAQFQQLWKRYFKSTNIEARKNMKLHLQHVPRRYWKYLVEKNLN